MQHHVRDRDVDAVIGKSQRVHLAVDQGHVVRAERSEITRRDGQHRRRVVDTDDVRDPPGQASGDEPGARADVHHCGRRAHTPTLGKGVDDIGVVEAGTHVIPLRRDLLEKKP